MTSLPERLIAPMMALRQRMLAMEHDHAEQVANAAPGYRDSARNLLHYLGLRQVDVRELQDQLASLGLSSLGRSEAHALQTLDAVLLALHKLAGCEFQIDPASAPIGYKAGGILLDTHARQLLGDASGKRAVRIMVTMPSEAASNPDLVRHLLASGMDVMRINCAHDDTSAWVKMIEHLRRTERELGRRCKVYADLAGPKFRTGALAAQAHVLKLRPKRDAKGNVVQPARVWLVPDEGDPARTRESDGLFCVPVTSDVLQHARRGDVIEFVDCRGKDRALTVAAKGDAGALVEGDKTAYLEAGTTLNLVRKRERVLHGRVGNLPLVTETIGLTIGDTLFITSDDEPGRPAVRNARGDVTAPARISCALEDAFDDVKPGERMWFDDGKIGGLVSGNDGKCITVQITHAPPSGGSLGAEKGINLPDSNLRVPALTPKDLDDLAFMAPRADMIGLSFVRSPEDILHLEAELTRLKCQHVGIVLKIENRRAFENLPKLLLTSLQSPPVGVMVARGDLAVEVGFERLAEVQEEILWLCEAAHVPVIWATQVLETLAKRGAPSRAEVSDAVMSGRAECVMLNKGPYIVEAVRFLNGLLERMAAHQSKKRPRFRRLSVSELG
jgi:pyruvate kinase